MKSWWNFIMEGLVTAKFLLDGSSFDWTLNSSAFIIHIYTAIHLCCSQLWNCNKLEWKENNEVNGTVLGNWGSGCMIEIMEKRC